MALYKIMLKKGLRAQLPATASPGEPIVTLDTCELFIGDINGDVKKVSDIFVSNTEPANTSRFWWDTNVEILKRYNGTGWVQISTANLADYYTKSQIDGKVNDLTLMLALPKIMPINFDNISVGNFILPYNPIKLGTVTLQ